MHYTVQGFFIQEIAQSLPGWTNHLHQRRPHYLSLTTGKQLARCPTAALGVTGMHNTVTLGALTRPAELSLALLRCQAHIS